jgi:hypothetical protein
LDNQTSSLTSSNVASLVLFPSPFWGYAFGGGAGSSPDQLSIWEQHKVLQATEHSHVSLFVILQGQTHQRQ